MLAGVAGAPVPAEAGKPATPTQAPSLAKKALWVEGSTVTASHATAPQFAAAVTVNGVIGAETVLPLGAAPLKLIAKYCPLATSFALDSSLTTAV
jgi:hypothetical protein